MVKKNAPKIDIRSTKEKGDEFEREVADIFRCMPGTHVAPHVKVGGKDVDLLVRVQRPFSPELKIVVDTKNYDRVISRDKAAAEFSSYYPLIVNGDADQFMLVTKMGIVANARQIFNGVSALHFTMSELENLVINPHQLLSNMESQFSSDKLIEYYVQAKCFNVNMQDSVKNYNEYYSDFISFCVSAGINSLDRARRVWQDGRGIRGRSSIEEYDEGNFARAIVARQNRHPLKDLEGLVWSWLFDQSHSFGIALLGTYGTGKSSFARRIAHRAAMEFKSGKSERIPLLIELREFGSHQSIEGLITHTLVNKNSVSNGSFELFKKMNYSGRYFIILDGFDEMKQGMTKDALIYNFSELNSLCIGRSKVMLCGRPTMFESDEEKSAILSGSLTTDIPNQAKYIPIEIAPLGKEAIFEMISNYVKSREPKDAENVTAKINDMRGSIQNNPSLVDLLSRPVHIPMFVTILPDFRGDILKISRGFLYETFIRKIILREVHRLLPAYHHRYSTEQRMEFVGSLAFEMAKRGEARSIRRSEIPEIIVSPFVNQGENVEIALRDLVAACFLEQKPPDILSFGHKSFLEFLTAYYMVSVFRKAKTDVVLIYPTLEISSFVMDLCESSDIVRALTNSVATREFIVRCFLHSVLDLRISPTDRKAPKRNARTRFKFEVSVLMSEKVRDLLGFIASASTIELISGLEMSPETRHTICLVLYLSSFELKVSHDGGRKGIFLDNTYSQETWQNLEKIASEGNASEVVYNWRKSVENPSHIFEKLLLDKESVYQYPDHLEFLSFHYHETFGRHSSLSNIDPGTQR